MNYRLVIKVLGSLLIIEGFFLLISLIVSLFYGETDVYSFIVSTSITLLTGGVIALLTRKVSGDIGRREGYIIVSLVWIVFSFFGSLPFYIGGFIPSYTDAFFETMSGFTTTGASILNNIESLPHGILFWRSLTQWIGGMGIIVLSLAILPMLGIGGMQLFVAEVPGPTPDKLHPRIKETAKRLWGIYVIFTVAETILLLIGGMSFFDAINHSFTTMATGGYSTKQASIAFFDSAYIQYIIILFMFFAGTNFTLSYFALKLRFKSIIQNEEFRYYFGFVLGFTVLIGVVLYINDRQSTQRAFHTIEETLPIVRKSFNKIEKPFKTIEEALLSEEEFKVTKENLPELAKSYLAIDEFRKIRKQFDTLEASFDIVERSIELHDSPKIKTEFQKINDAFIRIEQSPLTEEFMIIEHSLHRIENAFQTIERSQTFEKSFRDALFQVVSLMTTTGYATADYLMWVPFLSVVAFVVMFFGGSAGSTGGGIKIVRIVLLLKNSALEFKRLIHPNAVIPVRLNHHAVDRSVIMNVLAFVVFYMITFIVGTVIMSVLGLDLNTSMGAVIACLGNIGPGIGDVGPSSNFAFIPDAGKWFLSFFMLIGRLELFTVLILFSRAFWKN